MAALTPDPQPSPGAVIVEGLAEEFWAHDDFVTPVTDLIG
jgi:hypothetical protein